MREIKHSDYPLKTAATVKVLARLGALLLVPFMLTSCNGSPLSQLAGFVRFPMHQSLVFWGDSLTEGTGASRESRRMPDVVSIDLGDRPYVNKGMAGNDSRAIAARAKALPTLVTLDGGQIPERGTISLSDVSTNLLGGYGTRSLEVSIQGVLGTLERVNEPKGSHIPLPYTFTRKSPGKPVAVSSGTPIDFAVDADLSLRINVIWSGRNDSKGTDTVGNIKAMVDTLPKMGARYVILSVLNGEGEVKGTPSYESVIARNLALQAAFPENFVDVRALLTAGTIDDTVPKQYRVDAIHLNNAGYQIVADGVVAFIRQKGW